MYSSQLSLFFSDQPVRQRENMVGIKFFTSVPDLLQANVWLQENQMDEMSVRITQQ